MHNSYEFMHKIKPAKSLVWTGRGHEVPPPNENYWQLMGTWRRKVNFSSEKQPEKLLKLQQMVLYLCIHKQRLSSELKRENT